ncbi:MAG: hypothetical protein AAFU79_20190, partial [Myxococcota bacterium]
EPSVLFIPLEARAAAPGAAEAASVSIRRALGEAGVTVPSAERVDLLEQARGCDYDVFCLVEVARVLDASRVLVGELDAKAEGWSLRLLALDVEQATLDETVAMTFEPELEVLRAAAALAARRLTRPPSLSVELRLEPANARVRVFGEPLDLALDGPARLWPGRWRFELEAEGWAPRKVWVDLHAKASPVVLRMERDPLAVAPRPGPFDEEPFGRPSRRRGSGVTVDDAGRLAAAPPPPPSRFLRPLPWVVVGLGAVAAAGGAALMVDASGRYDTLAAEPGFLPGSASAMDASALRDDLRGQFLAGSLTALGGALTTLVGVGWLVLGASPESGEGSP